MKDFLLLMAHATSDDINYQHKDKSGRAVLHVACVRGHASVVQILLWVRTISSQTTYYLPNILCKVSLLKVHFLTFGFLCRCAV